MKGVNVAPALVSAQQMIYFQQKLDNLENKLESRPERRELLDSHIIKAESYVSSNLQATQQTLKFQTTVDTIDHKLDKAFRPSAESLKEHNIMKGNVGSMAPNLQATATSLRFLTIAATLDHKLEKRPALSVLFDSHILKTSLENANKNEDEDTPTREPAFLLFDGFHTTADTLESKLEHRPQMESLIENNILKENCQSVAPSLAAAQQNLSKHRRTNSLNIKLTMRPSKGHLKELNILKPEGVAMTVDLLARQRATINLTHKIEHRPSVDDLIAQNVLI